MEFTLRSTDDLKWSQAMRKSYFMVFSKVEDPPNTGFANY